MTIVYPGVLAPGGEFHSVIRPRMYPTPAPCWLWPHSECVREDESRLDVNCVSGKGEGHSVGWPRLMSLLQSFSHSHRNSSIHCLKLFYGPEGPLMPTNHLLILFFFSLWEHIGHKDCPCCPQESPTFPRKINLTLLPQMDHIILAKFQREVQTKMARDPCRVLSLRTGEGTVEVAGKRMGANVGRSFTPVHLRRYWVSENSFDF